MPEDFRVGLKVTDAITLKKFPNLRRFGLRAGKPNEHFLNPEVFKVGFLKPSESLGPKLGVIFFEFSRFWPTDYEHGRDFLAALDAFLEKLPTGWPYAIEPRIKHWLVPDYFACRPDTRWPTSSTPGRRPCRSQSRWPWRAAGPIPS